MFVSDGAELIEGPNVGTGDGINDGAGLDVGPGVGTGDGLGLDEGPASKAPSDAHTDAQLLEFGGEWVSASMKKKKGKSTSKGLKGL